MVSSELLVKYGFIKKDKLANYTYDEKSKTYQPMPGFKIRGKDADEEIAEVAIDKFGKTGYPKSIKRFEMFWEMQDMNLEEPYFWFIDNVRQTVPIIEKVEDSFSASENSAFFGVTQQRLGIQQDKVGQFLATTGKMVKELFQMVRELRILDERLTYYEESYSQLSKPPNGRSKSAEITLKGIFIDLVQGGSKTPGSIYGMARELEFITLPDLFFDAPPFNNTEEMENHVSSLRANFNEALLRVLVRHLRQFMEWKKRTHKEHANRKEFMLKYLRQHYNIIQMYLAWLKPYLRTIKKLNMKEGSDMSYNMISAFESSLTDIEVLCHYPDTDHCLMVTFNFRTRPHMKFVQEGYQRGPVHVGQMRMVVRALDWKKSHIRRYKALKEAESLELMGDLSGSVQQSMEALGGELERYLKEAEGIKDEDEKEKKSAKKSVAEMMFGDFINFDKLRERKASSGKKDKSNDEDAGLGDGRGAILFSAWGTYKNFKKAHRMVTW
ncbi:MAG: hypothetical protein ABIG93_01595 [archaeon]|nr:hypothetical protein [Nanoarchaeota archaeon]